MSNPFGDGSPLAQAGCHTHRRASRNRPPRHRLLTRWACARLVATPPLRRLAAPRIAGQAESGLTHERPLPGGPAPGLGDFSANNPRRGQWTSQRWPVTTPRASEVVILPQPCEGDLRQGLARKHTPGFCEKPGV